LIAWEPRGRLIVFDFYRNGALYRRRMINELSMTTIDVPLPFQSVACSDRTMAEISLTCMQGPTILV
jgi:hypothetical protein